MGIQIPCNLNGHLDFRDWSAQDRPQAFLVLFVANVHDEPWVIGQPCQMAPADRKPSLESQKVAGRKKDKVAGLRMSAAKIWDAANSPMDNSQKWGMPRMPIPDELKLE